MLRVFVISIHEFGIRKSRKYQKARNLSLPLRLTLKIIFDNKMIFFDHSQYDYVVSSSNQVSVSSNNMLYGFSPDNKTHTVQ